MAGKPEKGFKIEYSKSNRAGCKGCGQKIEKDSLRLGRMMPSPHFDGFVSCRRLARLSLPVYNSENCQVIIVRWLLSACLRADAIVCFRHNLPAFVVIFAGAALGTLHFHASLSPPNSQAHPAVICEMPTYVFFSAPPLDDSPTLSRPAVPFPLPIFLFFPFVSFLYSTMCPVISRRRKP